MSMTNQYVIGEPQVAVYPAEVDDTEVGTTLDFDAYESMQFAAIQIIGAVGGTTPSLTGNIQESTEGTSWTDVTGATFTSVISSNNVQTLTGTRTKRYLRHARTVTGTSPSFRLSAYILPTAAQLTPEGTVPLVVVNSTTDVSLVAAPGAGFKLRVYELALNSDANESVQLLSVSSEAVETQISGLFNLKSANQPFTLPYNRSGHFDCLENESLKLDKSASGAVTGFVRVDIVPVG